MGFVLCLKAIYDEKGFHYKLKLFGGTLLASEDSITDGEAGNNIKAWKLESKKENEKEEEKDIIDKTFEEHIDAEGLEQEDEAFLFHQSDFEEEKTGIRKKIGMFLDNTVSGIKNKVCGLIHKFRMLKAKVEEYKRFLRHNETKETLKSVKKGVLKILKHLKPTQIKGELLYGAGNPASTGKQLGYMSIALPFYYDKVDITPDFSKKVLEGYISVKGRVRLGSLAVYLLQMILNKNTMATIKRFKKISGGK